jgi:hypothetical protein
LLLIGTGMLLSSAVRAHGDPAAVLEVVRATGDRPELLRLSEGMADLRMRGRARYLCPALFDSEETPRAAALPDGPTIVTSGAGAYLLFADGTVERHPDAALDAGTITALAAGAGGVLALRVRTDGAELLSVDAERARVLARVPATLGSLAVEDDGVLVAGLASAGRAEQRGFDSAGAERNDWNAQAATPMDAVAAFARVAGAQPYLVVVAQNGLGSELARLDGAGGYTVLQRAGAAVGGPVTASGRTWFTFDGHLAELRGGEVVRSMPGAIVTCIGRVGPLAYACTPNELVRLADGELGERLFGLDQLEPPELSSLDAALAERCNLQWLRFRVDLVAAGVRPNDDDGGAANPGRRDGGSADASSAGDGPRDAHDQDEGCSIGRAGSAHDARSIWRALLFGWLAAGLARWQRRHGRGMRNTQRGLDRG